MPHNVPLELLASLVELCSLVLVTKLSNGLVGLRVFVVVPVFPDTRLWVMGPFELVEVVL